MKRSLIIFLAAAVTLAAAGCASEETQETGINVYYVNASGDGLTYENTELSAEYSDELVSTLIDEIQSPIDSNMESSVLQNGITVASYGYDRSSEQLDIDLSGDYGSMANTGKLLLTAGLTLTFEQIDGIDDVYITIQGEPLLDSNGDDIGSLDSEDFVIHSGNEINIYTNTSMKLFFLNNSGERLVSETRNVYYNSNIPLEQVVLDELVKGPSEAGHRAALADTVNFLSVTIQEGVCYVNFDENAVQSMAMYDTELALDSIVQSIYSVCGVDKVQFSVNGDTLVEFADGTTIDHIYEAN